MSGNESTILVIDRTVSLVMELKDDSKLTFVEAIGISTDPLTKILFYLMQLYSRTYGISVYYITR